uniref:Uncharacterized protein n=1 Tax=Candidatus Kentrum sp. FM TaxID=2126340 RepID=A0A450RV59_9GAMM|nr:MAG: hypothetical protein BECKFM1743A_GA0114220_1000225 [Candidatus Kentron sp. FM]VFJ43547.1 MAG: hypothetical protein BECKFM1743C_GA0114222_1000225 [Candidatus Kentron sp. FM]VFK05591.1 MAG: hypothetical protein BECKFM1743B_GA0114221_1000225 [Candidatus Kentron sp. FM]
MLHAATTVDMEFLFNDLSMEGEFRDTTTFVDAIGRLIKMREAIRKGGRELHCHRDIGNAQVMGDVAFSKAIQGLHLDKKRTIMQWITRQGPFWDDDRIQDSDQYLECCDGKIVTDSGIGEAAYRELEGNNCHVVSLTPSSWAFTPIAVTWVPNNGKRPVDVTNHWTDETLEAALHNASAPITSWEELEQFSRKNFVHLTFSEASFEPLGDHPFVKSAAHRIRERFRVLDEFKSSFEASGRRTAQGQEIYQKYFTGDNAWFSDSSDDEKHRFRKELTFRHPTTDSPLFCPWHGKVKTSQYYRIHFSWPVRVGEPLYVVYIGPKITKR